MTERASSRDLAVRSPYLDVLEAQRADLIAALEPAVSTADIEAAHRASARLSVRLDASPLSDATADAVDAGTHEAGTDHRGTHDQPAGGVREHDGAGWASALRLEGMPTQDVAAVEYRGVRAAQAAEPRLAAQFLTAPVPTLEQVHRLVVSGLLAGEHRGGLRRTSRAVNDGAQGRAIFHAPPPAQLPELVAELGEWVVGAHTSVRPLALAGVVHARILQWRPFEAGNGRVARCASRIALRATGGDPWGVAVPEERYAADPLRYMTEIAATIRRRSDMRPWNELTGAAVVDGLERTARVHGLTPADVDVRALHAVEALDADAVDLPDLAGAAGLDRAAALRACNRLCWAGVLRRAPGTRGLRYHRPSAADVSDRSGA